jgi:hypothetical protein
MHKIIDVSGTGHSGHSAAVDLLSEVDGIKCHYSLFHFELMRQPGGIYDLLWAINDNWSEIRTDFALKMFLRHIKGLNESYKENLGPNFESITNNYFNSLVEETLQTDWFDSIYFTDNNTKQFIKDLLSKLGMLNLAVSIKSLLNNNRILSSKIEYQGAHTVYLSSGHEFKEKTIDYINKILTDNIENEFDTVVINNSFDPYRANRALELLKNAYSIIIVRDPRDIYASLFNKKEGFRTNFEKHDKRLTFDYLTSQRIGFLGADNLSKFIYRQKLTRSKLLETKSHKRKLIIRFEDLINNYEETVKLIFDHLDIDSLKHKFKKTSLIPENSASNIGIWKNHNKLDEISLIEAELSEFIYND